MSDDGRKARTTNMDGMTHVQGECCYPGTIFGAECRKCGGRLHREPVYGGIAEVCEACPEDDDLWEPRTVQEQTLAALEASLCSLQEASQLVAYDEACDQAGRFFRSAQDRRDIGAEIDKILGMYVTEETILFERNGGGIDETTADMVGRRDLLRDALVTAVSARFAALEAELAAARSVRLLARRDVSDIQYALDVAALECVLGAARCADLCAAVAQLAAPADEVAS